MGLVVGLAVLAFPGQALAHGRSATVALDYRLAFDPATAALAGVHAKVLDGDRDLQLRVAPGVAVVVRGSLGEPSIRIDSRGVWANADSPTATADKVVSSSRHGWVQLSHGRTITWHDHRLAPPPSSKVGLVGRFSIPIDVNGKRSAIGGTFTRVSRPAVWPWLLGAAVIAGVVLVLLRRRPWRGWLTIGLGALAGVAALLEVTTFAVRDAPTGGIAWLQIGTAVVIAAIFLACLVRLQGRSRIHAAGVVGAVAAAVSLSSLPVYWHGVVISALAPNVARVVCGLALVLGVGAALLSFMRDFDEPARRAPVRRATVIRR